MNKEEIKYAARLMDHELDELRDDEYDWYRVHKDGSISTTKYNEIVEIINNKRIVIQGKIIDLENQIGERLRDERRSCWNQPHFIIKRYN
jgi:hypothetical protein